MHEKTRILFKWALGNKFKHNKITTTKNVWTDLRAIFIKDKNIHLPCHKSQWKTAVSVTIAMMSELSQVQKETGSWRCVRPISILVSRLNTSKRKPAEEKDIPPSSLKSFCAHIHTINSAHSSSNWILMSCQPHRVTSGQSDSGPKQINISKLFSHLYQPSVKSIYKTNHFANMKHTYTNIRHKFSKS